MKERILAVWAEKHSGPGWRNSYFCVLVADTEGRFRVETIGHNEMTDVMWSLFNVSFEINESLRREVSAIRMRGDNAQLEDE